MTGPDKPRGGTELPLFALNLLPDLPPFPGEPEKAQQHRPTVADLLRSLMISAQCNVIRAPAAMPDDPSLVGSFAALAAASGRFLVAPGLSLANLFWTHAAALRQGAVARALDIAAPHALDVQGFLALYAQDVRSPLLYGENTMPFRVRDAIEVPADPGGPYLVLIVCQRAPDGGAEPICGYAQPIYHAQRFVPVASELERDVLRVLEHLQVALDAHGVELDIVRNFADAGEDINALCPSRLSLALRAGDTRRKLTLSLTPGPGAGSERSEDVFVAGRNALASGALASWVEKRIGELAHDP